MSIKAITDYPMPTATSCPANKTNWTLDSSQAVLLIHDMQQYFLNFYAPESALIQTLIQHLQQLHQWAHQHQVPVVYTAQPHQQSLQERGLLTDVWGPGITNAPLEQQTIVTSLTPSNDDIVLTKWRYSAFQRSDLLARLQHWQRRQLIIGGVYAHIGCMLTASEAFMQDIQVFFVADALADFSANQHHYALDYVANCCGQLTTTAAIIQHNAGLSQAWLTQKIRHLIEMQPTEALDPAENLILYGLDSLRIMQFAAELKQHGLDIGFEQLGHEPSLNHWWDLLQSAQITQSAATQQ